ncbi:hypothetical protein A5893_02410 [Pedobacter psychrophilus]|uniref:SusE outer membrane protein domain-containing protein n=1 Tax=Pedobacter psychrophilus TaxID=1826909 RepID=A0A179DNA5_9SPHI|nr:hypothetical protein [Pedobacter psychrophilus]OAQ41993.1 hypothetical protein A5893_02410 [Pedobacter psychrophilus]
MRKRFHIKPILAAMLILGTVSCTKNGAEKSNVLDESSIDDKKIKTEAVTGLVFQSRFDNAASGFTNTSNLIRIVNVSTNIQDILGATAGLDNSDWDYNLETPTVYGFSDFRINYEGGSSTDRYAQLVTYPAGSTNRNLQFVIKNATVPVTGGTKGRVATDLFSKSRDPINPSPTTPSGIKQYKQEIKFFIPPSWSTLTDFTFVQGDFLLLFEFGIWQAVTGSDGNADKSPFRVRYDIKTKGTANTGRKIVFEMTGEDLTNNGFVQAWKATPLNNTDFPIEPGNWYQAEIYVKEGGPSTGRATLALRKLGFVNNGFTYPAYTKVFDSKAQVATAGTNRVVGKKNGVIIADNVTTGFTNFAPMKLYGNNNVVDGQFVDSNPLQIWFDDLTIKTNVASSIFP